VIESLPHHGAATRLVLVRHAEPDGSARGRVCGRTDVPLGAAGRRQADALGVALAAPPFAAVYASPLARAFETARPIAAAHRLDPNVVHAWAKTPGSVRFPGGESLTDLRARVLPAVETIRGRHPGAAVGIVAHAGVLRVVLGDALGLPDDGFFRLDQSHGGVSVVDWLDGTPLVRVVNAAAGL